MASWKGVKAIVETKHPKGWSKIIKLLEKRDWFGLGYQPSLTKKEIPTPKDGKRTSPSYSENLHK